MIVVFVRHGAPRNNESDPELTSFGHRMSIETGQWLKNKGWVPSVCFSTKTRRTFQTAENLLLGCQVSLVINPFDMAEDVQVLDPIHALLTENLFAKVALVCCHQPLLEHLRLQYAPHGPPIRFATAFIMRYSEGQWICIDTWAGRVSY